MQEMAGEQGAAYIPMPKGRGFAPRFDNGCMVFVHLSAAAITNERLNHLSAPPIYPNRQITPMQPPRKGFPF